MTSKTPSKGAANAEKATQSTTAQNSNLLKEKFILITGGTSGLGAESAVALARHNPARIYISGRKANAAKDVIDLILAEQEGQCSEKEGQKTEVIFLPMDLADLESVSSAADRILTTGRMDIILCNAGIAAVPYGLTMDGYEIQMGTNHLGHALLVSKLLGLLGQSPDGGRVVSVSSFAWRGGWGGFGCEDGKGGWVTQDGFGLGVVTRWLRYAESKLANVVYMRELAGRYPGVTSVSVTPGFVDTGMVKGMGLCDRVGTRVLASLAGSKGMVSPEEGAENQVWACLVGKERLVNGGLYDPVGVLFEEERLIRAVRDREVGERLWRWTEGAVGGWM